MANICERRIKTIIPIFLLTFLSIKSRIANATGEKGCGSTRFQCLDGECIPMQWHCDNNFDCEDRSDEMNCTRTPCKLHEFQCHFGKCIDKALWCNKHDDCNDGSDESDCEAHMCPDDLLRCENRLCIPQVQRCEEFDLCLDGSDGKDCQAEHYTVPFARRFITFYDYYNFAIQSPSVYKEIYYAWQYVQNTFRPVLNHSKLHIVSDHKSFDSNTNVKNKICFLTSGLFKNKKGGFPNVIHCNDSRSLSRNEYLDEIVPTIGQLALPRYGSQTAWDWPAQKVSRLTILSIIVYDIYSNLDNMQNDADRWREREQFNFEPFPHPNTFWFDEWYLKIYNAFGKTKILKNFFSILHLIGLEKVKQLNMGEFVHFWSGAAGSDLRKRARAAFGWNSNYTYEFNQARITYPNFNYTCIECDATTTTTRTTNVGQDQGSENKEAIPSSVIIGIIVGVLMLTIMGLGLVIAVNRKRIKHLNEKVRDLTPEEVAEFYNGNGVGGESDGPIHSRPFNPSFEIARDRLLIDQRKVLGSGEFGIVKKGILKGENSGASDLTVAVKMVKPHVEVSYFKAFLSEIKTMSHLGQHLNIAAMLAVVVDNIQAREVLVALEFCAKGDLLRYLSANSEMFEDLLVNKENIGKESKCVYSKAFSDNVTLLQQGSPEIASNSKNICTMTSLNLIEWSRQVSNGMNYLSSLNVIHGDLAARNILLTQDGTAKISDFGLSRQLNNYLNYSKKSKTPLPWRWLAIESLTEMTFSVHSDIWAFGVTLWEIFSLGKVPYSECIWNQEFVTGLVFGTRLPSPEFGNQEIYDLMLSCMTDVPSERVSFSEIKIRLENLEKRLTFNTKSSSEAVQYLALEPEV